MTLQIFITEEETKAFFIKNGYSCQYRPGGFFTKEYHGRSEWVDTDELTVECKTGKRVPAAKLLPEVIKQRLLMPDQWNKAAIEVAIKKHKG